jgi:hypothetical protein
MLKTEKLEMGIVQRLLMWRLPETVKQATPIIMVQAAMPEIAMRTRTVRKVV